MRIVGSLTGTILIFSFIFIGNNLVFAQTNNSLFLQANNVYNEGKFEKAREMYEKLIFEKNVVSAEVFYNLANCYFKMNDLGKAILNYKRAFMVHPRDKLINDNLSFARGLVKYKVEDTRNWYIRKGEEILSYITEDELHICSLLLFSMIVIFWILVLFTKSKIVKRLTTLLYILFFISIGAVVFKHFPLSTAHEAVIIADEAEVRYGPTSTDKIAFRLIAGIEVILKSEKDDWVKIGLHSGKEGWINKTSLEAVKWR